MPSIFSKEKSSTPRWDAALKQESMAALAKSIAEIIPEAWDVLFIPESDIRYQNNAGSDPLCAAEIVDSSGRIGVCVYYSDRFFESESVSVLLNNGWSDTHAAQIAFFHEIIHAIIFRKILKNGDNAWQRNSAHKLLTSALHSWPLVSIPGSPSLTTSSASKIMTLSQEPRPLFLIAQTATDKSKLPWIGNLEELRADAGAIALCRTLPCKSLSDHPLRVDFDKAIRSLHLARLTDKSGFYRWGLLGKLMVQLMPNVSTTPAAISLSENLAYLCANRNAVFLLRNKSQPYFKDAIFNFFSFTHTHPSRKYPRLISRRHWPA
jgi:hypothetical protein